MPICIPDARGVPALPGPPNWWIANDPNNPLRVGLDEPRWRGATMITYAPGTSEEAVFRALHHNANLYLSWYVKADPTGPTTTDALYVGFSNPGAAGGPNSVMVRIGINTAGTNPSDTYSIEIRKPNATVSGQWDVDSNPGAATWLTSRARIWTSVSVDGATIHWAVQMIVPLNQQLLPSMVSLPANFRMWFSMGVDFFPAQAQYTWPRTKADGTPATVTGSQTMPSFPDVTEWGEFQVGGANCEANVSIEAAHIGTTNPDSHEIIIGQINTFIARPRNLQEAGNPPDPAKNIPANAIQARFRIANWGSQSDWNVPSAGVTPWEDITGNNAPGNNNNIPAFDPNNADPAHNLGLIEQPYTPDPSDFQGASPRRRRHQCMLVELTSTTSLVFMPASVARNMNFVTASRFSRLCEISVVGLKPIAPWLRDVYLYVETLNMPLVKPDRPPPDDGIDIMKGLRLQGKEGGDDLQELIRLAKSGRFTLEQIAQFMPTYRVHAYHDTGATTTLKEGRTRRIVSPQGSFGYFAEHTGGPILGWDHRLRGAIRIAENLYLVKAPNNGSVDVTTVIHAVELGDLREAEEPIEPWPPPLGCTWWLWLPIARVIGFIRLVLSKLRPGGSSG